MPETLIFSFAKLIEFYKTDLTNDDKEILEDITNVIYDPTIFIKTKFN